MKTLSIEDKPTVRGVKARVPHGVKSHLVVILYWDGTLGLREHRRRKEYQLDLGTLLTREIVKEAMARKAGRRKTRL